MSQHCETTSRGLTNATYLFQSKHDDKADNNKHGGICHAWQCIRVCLDEVRLEWSTWAKQARECMYGVSKPSAHHYIAAVSTTGKWSFRDSFHSLGPTTPATLKLRGRIMKARD